MPGLFLYGVNQNLAVLCIWTFTVCKADNFLPRSRPRISQKWSKSRTFWDQSSWLHWSNEGQKKKEKKTSFGAESSVRAIIWSSVNTILLIWVHIAAYISISKSLDQTLFLIGHLNKRLLLTQSFSRIPILSVPYHPKSSFFGQFWKSLIWA